MPSLRTHGGRTLGVCLLVVVALLVASPVLAFQPRERSGPLPDLADRVVLRPGGVIAVEARSVDDLASGDPLRAGWDRFRVETGGRWRAWIDERTALPTLVTGSGLAWIPGRGNDLDFGREPTLADLERLAREFLANHVFLLGDWSGQLEFDPDASSHPTPSVYRLVFRQRVGGVRVEGSRYEFDVVHGNLVAFGAYHWAPVTVSPAPAIDAETARASLLGALGLSDAGAIAWLGQPELVLVPVDPRAETARAWDGPRGAGVTHRLIWRFAFRGEDDIATWTGEIDAHSGELFAFYDATEYEQVQGGVFPHKADGDCADDGCEVDGYPMPFADISIDGAPDVFTGDSGIYSCDPLGAPVTTNLIGTYVEIADVCGPISETATCDEPLALGLKGPGENCASSVSSAGNTAAARTAFYQVNRAAQAARAYLPSNTWLQSRVRTRTNVNNTCNASWSGQINMFRAGNGCGNTGENQGVLVHEWGHGFDQNDGGGTDNPGEAYADVVAILAGRDACVGPGFFVDGRTCSGYGDTCLSCTGIRDHDWDRREQHTPATPANFTQPNCGGGGGPCGREVHCEAYPPSEAIFDLAARDLPAAGLDADSAWQLTEKLWYESREGSGGPVFNCSLPNSDGCNTNGWYHSMRLIDDDNGNLADGTPHAAAIFAAFDRHAIACGAATDPENTDSSSCPVLAAPVVTARALTNEVELSWDPVAGATNYTVFRNEAGCDRQQVIVGNTTATTFTDDELANDFSVFYRVQAHTDNSACDSPVSNCLETSPQPFAGKVRFQAATYGCSHAVTLKVVDANVGASTVTVEVSSDTEPTPETVVLTETAPDSGKYLGEILSTSDPAVSGDGLLSTTHGDNLHVEYIDADDGAGGTNLLRTHDATSDCVLPVISNVGEENITGTYARVVWTTDEVADTVLVWGETKPPSNTKTGDPRTTDHAVTLTNLQECTVYFYEVQSTDPAGNFAFSDNGGQFYHFETLGDFGDGLQPCHAGQVTIDQATVDCSDQVTFRVVDLDLNTDPEAVETAVLLVTSTTEAEAEQVVVTETGPNTSRFTGSIDTAPGAPQPDGVLQTADGDVLTVSYADADDGSGAPAVSFDTAALDCAGPDISNLRVESITDARLTIRFDTDEPGDTVVEWGTTPALGNVSSSTASVTSHSMTLNQFDLCTQVFFRVQSTDTFGNVRAADENGEPFAVTTYDIPGLYYRERFENGPGLWTLEGEWEIGAPQGLGGSSGRSDPASAYNNAGILGQDLSGLGAFAGDYEPDSNEVARMPAQNASSWTNTKLLLYRRLNSGPNDDATLWLWTDTAVPIYNSEGNNVSEANFSLQTFDVAAKVDGAPSVFLEFRQQSNNTGNYSGWNVDDIIFKDGTLPDYAPCGACGAPPSFAGATSAADNDACGADGVTVSWNDAVAWGTGGAGTYAVYRGTTPDFVPSPGNLVASGVSGNSYLDATAPTDQTLYYVVRAENDETCSSGPANGGVMDDNLVRVAVDETTARDPAGAIDALEVTRLGLAHVRLSWPAPLNAASYNVYRSLDPQPETFALHGTTSRLFFDDLDVGADRESYFYLVRGANACGDETP